MVYKIPRGGGDVFDFQPMVYLVYCYDSPRVYFTRMYYVLLALPEWDRFIRHILTYKNDPRTERNKVFIMVVDP